MRLTHSFPIILFLFASLQTNAKTLKITFSSKLIPQGLSSLLDPVGLERKARSNAPSTNSVVKVVTSVKTGSGQTFDDVLVDTGSTILWVGGKQAYRPGPHTESLNTTFSVGYGSGGVSGPAFCDEVTIGEASVTGQIIGAANFTTGFILVKPIDGIFGLGPSGSDFGQVSGPFKNKATPTFIENLLTQGSIHNAIFGIYIAPLGVDGIPEGSGELTFGGVDTSRIQGDIVWVEQNPPVDFHWEFNVTAFSFGNTALSEPASARTDTGVLGIQIPFDSLHDILVKFNGTISRTPPLDGFLSFPSNATPTLPSLSFTLGKGTVFTLTPSRYLIPQNLYASLNLTQSNGLAYSWISSAGPGTFFFGQKWLENVYTAYDLENHRVGFARLA